MKKMLLGIFLLILSVWCLIYGKLDDLTIILFFGVAIPLPATALVLYGFFSKQE